MPAVLASVVVSFVGGALIERILIRPVEGTANPLNVVIITLGLFLAINALQVPGISELLGRLPGARRFVR